MSSVLLFLRSVKLPKFRNTFISKKHNKAIQYSEVVNRMSIIKLITGTQMNLPARKCFHIRAEFIAQ